MTGFRQVSKFFISMYHGPSMMDCQGNLWKLPKTSGNQSRKFPEFSEGFMRFLDNLSLTNHTVIFKLADRMRSMRTNGASKNRDWSRVFFFRI